MSLPYQQAQRFGMQPAANIIDVTCTTPSPSNAAAEVAPIRVSEAEPIIADSPPAGDPSKGTPTVPTDLIQKANGTSVSSQPALFDTVGEEEEEGGSSRDWDDEKWDADAEAKAVNFSHVDYSMSSLRADLEERSKATAPLVQLNSQPQKAPTAASRQGRPGSEGTHTQRRGPARSRNGSQPGKPGERTKALDHLLSIIDHLSAISSPLPSW